MRTDSGRPGASESPGRVCWFDATMLMHLTHQSGIPRTVASLLARWPQEFRDRMRFFELVEQKWIRLVDPAVAWRRAEACARKGGAATPSRGLGRIGKAVAALCPAPVHSIFRRLRRLCSKIGRTGEFSRRPPFEIRPQDVVFLPGGHFPRRKFFQALSKLSGGAPPHLWSVCYDLLPEMCPQYFEENLASEYSENIRESLDSGARYFAISENTKTDVLAYAARRGRPAPEVEVVRLGDELDRSAAEPVAPPALEGRLGPEGFVLCVSHFYPRKNQELLYQAWRQLTLRGTKDLPQLVFVSGGTSARSELLAEIRRDPLAQGRIHVLERIAEGELHWLYRRSKFVMYPATYEGWGLPVAEALAFGKYCIASNASSIPEIGGDLVDYHDPYDLRECCRLIARAVSDSEYVRRRERRAADEYRTTSWADCSGRIASVLFDESRRRAPRLETAQSAA